MCVLACRTLCCERYVREEIGDKHAFFKTKGNLCVRFCCFDAGEKDEPDKAQGAVERARAEPAGQQERPYFPTFGLGKIQPGLMKTVAMFPLTLLLEHEHVVSTPLPRN